MRINGVRRGVTFLEIMVVVVIFGILFAIALPNMSGPRERTALRGAARSLASGGLLARQMAITTGERTYLLFDIKNNQWRIAYMTEEQEQAQRLRDDLGRTQDERDVILPTRVSFKNVKSGAGEDITEETASITFYPNGSSSGLAVELANTRGRSLTIDFERSTARPEVYEGEPKSMAQKLRDKGLNPEDFGLEDDTVFAAAGSEDSGFSRTAGWDEEERVSAYKDAVERMLERSRQRYDMNQAGGPQAYYSEAQQWGN